MNIFVVGFERCGTHSIIDVLNASCTTSRYIVHEEKPFLCKEAYDYVNGDNWRTKEFVDKIEKYKWLSSRINVVCEANHRLGYFVSELNKIPNSRFVLLVRNPVETLVSRISIFSHWSSISHRYPKIFQEPNVLKIGKEDFNNYKICSKDMNKPIYELYLDEWIINYRETISQLKECKNVLIIKTEKLSHQIKELLEFIGADYFDLSKAVRQSEIKSDSVYSDPNKAELIKVAEELILPYSEIIKNRIREAFPEDELIKELL
jgi:hypothetical protein